MTEENIDINDQATDEQPVDDAEPKPAENAEVEADEVLPADEQVDQSDAEETDAEVDAAEEPEEFEGQDSSEEAPQNPEDPAHLLESAEPDMTPEEMAAIVEAILFATDNPLTLARVAKVAELPQRYVKDAINTLNDCYAEIGASFRIEQIAGGFQMMTLPEYNDILRRLFKAKKESRLGNAAMETLAIVAYRQPVIRADIEAIRGVSCGEVLRGLMERGLVKVVGRADVIGRPMLYGTTKKFLEIFGLASLKDLPKVEDLKKLEQSGGRKKPEPELEAEEVEADAEEAEESAADEQQEIPAAGEDELGVYVEDHEEDSDSEEYDEEEECDDEDEDEDYESDDDE